MVTRSLGGHGKVVVDPVVCRQWLGAERAVTVAITHAVYTERRCRLSWEFLNYAPQFE